MLRERAQVLGPSERLIWIDALRQRVGPARPNILRNRKIVSGSFLIPSWKPGAARYVGYTTW
jgi:hypothetical protein